MTCKNCGNETKPKEWTHYDWGIEEPRVIFAGNWCDQCHAYVTTKEESECTTA
jgi:hypothetical protein